MPDALLNHLLNLKVAKGRKGMAPNKPLLVLRSWTWWAAGDSLISRCFT
jgi:hypothetical protein